MSFNKALKKTVIANDQILGNRKRNSSLPHLKSPIDDGTSYRLDKPLLLTSQPLYSMHKQLPPITSFNPLTQENRIIERPPNFKSKDSYTDLHNQKYISHGFGKREGAFQKYNILIQKNQKIIDSVHINVHPTLIQLQERQINPIEPKYIMQSRKAYNQNIKYPDIKLSYNRQDNEVENYIQRNVDYEFVKSTVHKSKFLKKFDFSKQLKIRTKQKHNEYEYEQIDHQFHEDELSDVVSKVNNIDKDDYYYMSGNLSNFEKMIKLTKDYSSQIRNSN